MKRVVARILFGEKLVKRVLFGLASGMKVMYDPKNRTQHLLGIYEWEIQPYIKKGIRFADVLIDIGANDGYYGLAFAKHKKKRIILCEPGPIVSSLRENMELNGLKEGLDFEVIEKPVSQTDTEHEISLNSIIKNEKSVFVLIDVDGGEVEILSGFHFNVSTTITWVIETHSQELEHAVANILLERGYSVKIIDKAWWRTLLPEKRPLAHNRWLYAFK